MSERLEPKEMDWRRQYEMRLSLQLMNEGFANHMVWRSELLWLLNRVGELETRLDKALNDR